MKLAPIEALMLCASRATGINREDILKKSRKRKIVMSRQLIMIYLLSNYEYSYKLGEIGSIVGDKDHAAVIYHRKTYFSLLEAKDKNLIECVESFKSGLKAINPDFTVNMIPPKKILHKKRSRKINTTDLMQTTPPLKNAGFQNPRLS